MAGLTPNFNLTWLNSGDDFDLDGYKFTDADRVLIDRLLNAALTHDHSGVPAEEAETVDSPPVLTLDPTTGSLPAGVRFFYKIALIGEDGLPTLASPETTIDTPNPIQSPDAPTASRSAISGTLLPGIYYYRLSAYRSASTLETGAGDAVTVTLPPSDGSTQRVLLTLPSMPTGGEGYNIYRRAPGGSAFLHIATVPIADIGDPWIDTGAVAVNCERFSPSLNTTSSSNSVEIAYPGGVIPVGHTWRIYRTDVAGAWAHSHLIDVVEETTEGSGIITATYVDLGLGTRAGSPPVTTPPTIPTPAQIDYADLVGIPPEPEPPSVFPVLVTFAFPGALVLGARTFEWVCPYEQAMIRSLHANVGAHQTVVADTYVRLVWIHPLSDNIGAVTIAAGQNNGWNPFPDPDFEEPAGIEFIERGDRFSVSVADDDPDAPLTTDLTFQISLWVHETGAETIEWPELP